MALPALEKIRDGGLLVSSEQPHGTCNSVRGKCLDKIVGDLILPSKKYQSLSSIEKLDKVQLLHIENNEKWMFGRTKKLSSVKVEHGLRKLKVSKFETSISKGKDEDKEAFPDSLGKGSEDEENNTEDIEAESDKSAMDDMNNNGDGEVEGEERKNNKSEEGEEKDEKGADKVEFVKEDDDDQKKAGEGIPEKEVIDYDIGSNANQDEGRKNVSEETFREKTHKHVFKLKETRLLKKMLESKNLNTDHFPSTVSPHVQPEILADKPTVVHILNNDSKESIISKYTQKSEVETADAKLTAKVDKKTNATEKDVALKSAPQSPSTLKKKLMPSENSKHLADTKKPTKTERKDTKSKKSKNQRETSLTLAELNDVLLHVPSFVPNFTAVNDPICQQHGKIFLRQLRGFKLWALQMLDSSGKIPSSLLRGNVNQLGDFDQCLGISTRVKVDKITVKVQGKYCLATVDLHAAHSDMKLPVNLMESRRFIRGTMRDPGHFIPRFTTLNWALCLPAACSAADARRSIENSLLPYNVTSGIEFSINVDPEMCYVRQRPQTYTKETIGVLYLYVTILCLVMIATVRDCISSVQDKGNYSERIIMSFSLKRTMKSLFWKYSCGSGEITCIHGIRSLATIALYIAHKLIPLSSIPYSNRIALTEVANTPISSILRVSLVYTDSFLLLSGVLTAYNMAKERKIHGEIRWFCRIIARFIRLTPALIAIIFWYAFVMEHIGTGPQWNSAIKANADICKKNAWTNLLYIQNFFPFEEMCATHTHQLALDMQLSLIVPMLVFFLEIKPVIGILLIFFLLQLSATLRYLSTVNNNLSLVIFHGMTLKRLYKTANLTYILPLHRATPYLFGVGLGVLMNYTGRSIKLHKVFSILGWLIASALGSWSLFSPWKYARRDFTYDVEEAAYYAVISPVFSALALSWVIFACFTDHGGAVNKILSNYWLVVFSRISYAIYLSQFAVFFYNIGTTRYSSEFQVHTAIDPFEAMVVVAVSTVLTLLFDIPLQEVKNIIMECTGGLRTAEMLEQASKEEHERKMKDLASNDERRVRVIDVQSCDEHEEEPNRRNWRKGTFRELTTHQKDENIEQYSVIPPRPRRQVARRQSLIKMDQINRFGIPRNLADGDEADRRSRSSFGTLIKDLKTADDNLSSDMRSQASNNIGLKDNDDFTPGMIRRERFSPKRTSQREGVPSWELVGKNRAEAWRNSRSSRSLLKYAEARLLSSESEEDDHPKLRRRVQESRLSGEEKLIYNEEEFRDDDQDFPRRRSSAEGKMALLRDPVGQEMTLWTVSKVSQLESSQETSDMEDNEINIRKGKVKKSSFSETPSEEENNWELSKKRSLTTGSQFTSVENDGSVSTFDFVLWKDSERIPIQELSKLPQEEDELECGWNLIRTPDMEITKSSSGLFKRQSIIKSQASEEDPGYLLPERPKLVQQEQEHPFKKAWQEQKSRSEEDSYTVKEAKENKEKMEFRESKDKDTKEVKQHSDNVVKIEQSRQIGPLLDE
ncbi:uncharacterized protein LOC117172978 isoform X2 [Belonocnema kinseyi]|uniref:uncharacterized protein LOC117172978 isoform X2 n=1 Tax=Belonocnema kinseyi TaxID=2817044 RepID=UPI00143DD3BE|nr:uncharacterized protein LOC117172978 isoform X2 [Belonocnema kinseyi]